MKALESSFRFIDRVNEKVGDVVCWLFVPLGIITLYEVISRYLFNSPTIWVWDVNMEIFGVVILMGAGVTLLRDKHVKVDAVQALLPKRAAMSLNLIGMLALMAVAAVVIWQGGMEGWHSFTVKEKLNTIWSPYIFPVKMLIPIGGALLFFQGLRKFLGDLLSIVRGGADNVN